jgi:4-alpha-glucanotransferase
VAVVNGRRRSGVILHPTSLPGRFGIGDLGDGARRFVDFLANAGQRIWQVLPLGPTGYGDSPYQSLGAFAGNPLLVSLEAFQREGYLEAAELDSAPRFPEGQVDYGLVIGWRSALLRRASERFFVRAPSHQRRALEDFRERCRTWLDDLALFLALKALHGGAPWTRWEPALAHREALALDRARSQLAEEIRAQAFAQFAFFSQWDRVRALCRERGIAILGDLPIYVAHDSAEVWCHPEIFQLDAAGEPSAVAGVPPDYFSATGQLWGNPLYRWEVLKRASYSFWIERVRSALSMYDEVRLDHFRGFEAYWEVDAGAPTAEHGRWVPGPGAELFTALTGAVGSLPFVAENLGVITPAVEALRKRFGFPGMSILQFAFGRDPQAPSFLPHNHQRDLYAYTGTHDNDTVMGWWNGRGAGDSTRTLEDVERERGNARHYLATDGSEMNWVFIRAVLASVAGAALFPVQDLLGLGSEARMNRPSVASGNWRWRLPEAELTPALAARLRDLTELYGRG